MKTQTVEALMNKTRGEQLSLRFDVSKLDESALSDQDPKPAGAMVLSLNEFRRSKPREDTSQAVERTLLERALQSVRLFK